VGKKDNTIVLVLVLGLVLDSTLFAADRSLSLDRFGRRRAILPLRKKSTIVIRLAL
jgi:hypothetical protein